jgi:tetratricopeptide (TPR) repeat protein
MTNFLIFRNIRIVNIAIFSILLITNKLSANNATLIDSLKNQIALKNNLVKCYFKLSNIYLEEYRDKEAMACLEAAKLVAKGSDIAMVDIKIGNAFLAISKYDEAYSNYIKSYRYLQKNYDTVMMIKVCTNLSEVLMIQYKNKEALEFLYTTDSLVKTFSNKEKFKTLTSDNNFRKGNIYRRIGLYDKAMEINLNNIKLLEAKKENCSAEYIELGNIKQRLQENANAIPYYKKAFNNANQFEDKFNMYTSINNVARSFIALKKYDSATNYISQAKLYFRPTDSTKIFEQLMIKGQLLFEQKDFQGALNQYNNAIQLYNSKDCETMLSSCYFEMANIYIALHDYKLSKVKILESIANTKDVFDIESVRNGYKKLAEIEDFLQNYKGSALAYKIADSVNGIAFENAKINSVIAQEIKYETSLKEAQITQQASELSIIKKKNAFILLSSLLAGLSAIFGFLFFRNKQQQKQTESDKQKLVYQLSSIKSKVIPHFSGNILNAITYFFEIGESKKGIEYLSRYTELNKQILIGSDKPSASLESEITFLKNYIELEQLRFGEDLKFNLNIDATVDRNLQVPILLLHTFCENAIKHGIMSQKGNGTVDVNITNENIDTMEINITDDGIGREAASKLNLESTGQGLSILTKQIELYNENNSNKIKLNIEDIINNGVVAGTNVIVSIPVNYNYN